MRAHEFVTEALGHGNISKRKRYATRGLHVYTDNERINSDYALNRVMMAAACTDGDSIPDVPMHSFVGKYKSAHPYTEIDNKKLKAAYKAVGVGWEDMNEGDMDSDELDSTNIQSPLKPFKGYKRK